MIRVLLADDHQLLRQALRRAFEEAGLEVVAEANDGAEAVRLAGDLAPDVVVMDVTMPVLDGVEATRRLRAAQPGLPVVVLTMHDEHELRRDAIAAGASGFLTKDTSMQDVLATVRQVASGDTVLSADLAREMLGASRAGAAGAGVLTRREEEVLQHIADGRSTVETARDLFISVKTVKNHLASIYAKLDARDRTQAVLAAVRMGIVRLR